MPNPIKGKSIQEIAADRRVTQLLRQQIKAEDIWERAWKYCLKLGRLTHAPVTAKEYLRMKEFAADEALVEEVFHALKRYEVPNGNPVLTGFDVIGYFYSIALISQAKQNRDKHLLFLHQLTDQWIKEENSYGRLLHRNMKRLSKQYPDLKALESKWALFVDKSG
ncbi:hypothetical protein [Bacillus badius]|uniref:Uncharacterized protein n=1 Tax=Bacillus badius TaxID=1455 RepID=A0ABR5AXB3_BACBA|nr:hypothetical protein [Bacillus badius]KIL79370.1 hypothetical protein SD77_3236 [Bacillus badius]MED4716553.1 hypothetical protein [Bacillus badius]